MIELQTVNQKETRCGPWALKGQYLIWLIKGTCVTFYHHVTLLALWNHMSVMRKSKPAGWRAAVTIRSVLKEPITTRLGLASTRLLNICDLILSKRMCRSKGYVRVTLTLRGNYSAWTFMWCVGHIGSIPLLNSESLGGWKCLLVHL